MWRKWIRSNYTVQHTHAEKFVRMKHVSLFHKYPKSLLCLKILHPRSHPVFPQYYSIWVSTRRPLVLRWHTFLNHWQNFEEFSIWMVRFSSAFQQWQGKITGLRLDGVKPYLSLKPFILIFYWQTENSDLKYTKWGHMSHSNEFSKVKS